MQPEQIPHATSMPLCPGENASSRPYPQLPAGKLIGALRTHPSVRVGNTGPPITLSTLVPETRCLKPGLEGDGGAKGGELVLEVLVAAQDVFGAVH